MIEKTFNPILKEETFKRSFFPKIPIPGPKKAVLLLSGTGETGPFLIENGTQVRIADIRRGKYDQLVEIDLHPYNISFKEEVYSKDNVSKFTVTITATASVTEPDIVYQEQVHDVTQCVQDHFLAQIQEMAAEYSIRENAGLRDEIKRALSDISYLENGISLSNCNVIVQVDKKYESFLEKQLDLGYHTEFEKNKAVAAQEMKGIYADQVTAIFSEFAAGNIGVEEAIQRSKKGLSQDFDERLRQIREATDYIRSLEKDEMIREGDTLKNVEILLNGMISSISDMSHRAEKEVAGTLEDNSSQKGGNPYQEFEEDEE